MCTTRACSDLVLFIVADCVVFLPKDPFCPRGTRPSTPDKHEQVFNSSSKEGKGNHSVKKETIYYI